MFFCFEGFSGRGAGELVFVLWRCGRVCGAEVQRFETGVGGSEGLSDCAMRVGRTEGTRMSFE